MAKRKFGKKSEALYHAVKFEVKMTHEEFQMVLAISEILRMLFNSALAERKKEFADHIAPHYGRLKSAALAGEDLSEIRKEIREAYSQNSVTLFDQINDLTGKRADEENFRAVPRSFQEETLDALDGAFKSFVALRRNGDFDAKPPREKEAGFFQKIPGRFGFKVKGGEIVLSCGLTRKLRFPIPEGYHRESLAQAVSLKKFELYRDEPNLSKSGRFWISVLYEIPKPDPVLFEPERAVFLALGASSVGVVSPFGEEVLKLWRPDKHWQPKIESVEERLARRKKGSRGYQKLYATKRRMQILSARQGVLDVREVADYLISHHGVHFVVTDLVVRSKEGKLADSSKPERGGRLGLNWAAQNAGNIGRLVLLLENKTKEKGGSVRRHKLSLEQAPPGIGAENKVWIARKLQESFLS